MKKTAILAFIISLAGGIQLGKAAIVNGSASGLTNAMRTYTFDGALYSPNTTIANQFSSQGITFSPALFYDGNNNYQGCNFNDESGDCLSNFYGNGSGISGLSPVFSIFFTAPVTSAVFAIVTDAGTNNTTFAALRNGVVVSTFTGSTSLSNTNNYYGFVNSTPFDQLRVTTTGSNLAVIDNLATSTSTPEPGTVGMLILGLGGMGYFLRRQKTS